MAACATMVFVPNVFIAVCNDSVPNETSEFISPIDKPPSSIGFKNSFSGTKSFILKCRKAYFFHVYPKHSTAETACDTMVATAAPLTPMSIYFTHNISSATLSTAEIMRKMSGVYASPMALRFAASTLYIIEKNSPTMITVIYATDASLCSSITFIQSRSPSIKIRLPATTIAVTTSPIKIDSANTFLDLFLSPLPKCCAMMTAKPFASPTMNPTSRSFNVLIEPTAASASFPR